ncbi:SusE domain-containing protein [Hymenobacter sp. BT730]|uniref:SusE domain-containing protein n=1 Tax=Hymenobacter sp. BT730 TaxID=3063332 RepID=UPI0026E082E3|nr:SusE domain-containing protein [Hymenobacter sp. BT730]
MKNWLTQLVGVCAAVFLFSSCEKDEVRVMAQPGNAPTLTASANSVTLVQEDASKNAVTLSWKPGNYGFDAAQTYVIQFDKKDNKFAKPYEYKAGTSTSKTFTVSEINNIMLALGLPTGSEASVEVRVTSNLATNAPSIPVKTQVSGTTTLTGTPYLSFIAYPSIQVPGGYQGWSPATAPFLASPNSNDVYEGYIYMDAASEFKYTVGRSWDVNYGDDGTGSGLAPNGGNIKTSAPGYYKMNVDLGTKKYSVTSTTWAVIGSATAGGWDAETPMTYDAANGVWKVTTTLGAGELKFRANNAWAINMGDNGANGSPDYDGSNIVSPGAGSYTITLDLSKGAGNYSYSISKN